MAGKALSSQLSQRVRVCFRPSPAFPRALPQLPQSPTSRGQILLSTPGEPAPAWVQGQKQLC